MQQEIAVSIGFEAVRFIVSEDALRDRFMALTGLGPDDIRNNIQNSEFLASVLEFLVSHEPDLIAFADDTNEQPEVIVGAWRALGGGIGQEW